MADKCFCHLNGYKVKDADARKMIDNLQLENQALNNKVDEVIDAFNGQGTTNTNLNARLRNNEFNTIATILNHENDLDVFVIENFDTTEGIDTTKDDGGYIIANNYDKYNYKIVVPEGSIKIVRLIGVNVVNEIRKFFVHTDEEGEGKIEIYFSTDGGTTLNKMEKDTLQECVNGKSLVVQIRIEGNVTLHNICWGVK